MENEPFKLQTEPQPKAWLGIIFFGLIFYSRICWRNSCYDSTHHSRSKC